MRLRCKATGRVFDGQYERHSIEFVERTVEWPDGRGETTVVHTLDAGVFCSRGCLIDYLLDGVSGEADSLAEIPRRCRQTTQADEEPF